MLDKIFQFIQRLIASSERDRLDQKFSNIDQKFFDIERQFDEQLDGLVASIAELKHDLHILKENSFTNSEFWEEKLNASRTNTEALSDKFNTKFEYMQKSFERVENLILEVLKKN